MILFREDSFEGEDLEGVGVGEGRERVVEGNGGDSERLGGGGTTGGRMGSRRGVGV